MKQRHFSLAYHTFMMEIFCHSSYGFPFNGFSINSFLKKAPWQRYGQVPNRLRDETLYGINKRDKYLLTFN